MGRVTGSTRSATSEPTYAETVRHLLPLPRSRAEDLEQIAQEPKQDPNFNAKQKAEAIDASNRAWKVVAEKLK